MDLNEYPMNEGTYPSGEKLLHSGSLIGMPFSGSKHKVITVQVSWDAVNADCPLRKN